MDVIIDHLGKDISPLFNRLHASDVLQKILPNLTVAGQLDPAAKVETVPADEEADEIEARRQELPGPENVINLRQFESLAKHVLGEDSRAWKFFSSFADDGASELETCITIL